VVIDAVYAAHTWRELDSLSVTELTAPLRAAFGDYDGSGRAYIAPPAPHTITQPSRLKALLARLSGRRRRMMALA